MLEQLSAVVSALEQTYRTPQGFLGAGKATAAARQASEIVAQIGIAALDIVRLGFARSYLVSVTLRVDEVAVGFTPICVISLGSGAAIQKCLSFFPGERFTNAEA